MNPVRAADDPEIGRRLLNIRELERRTTLAVNNAGDIQLPLERDPRVIRWVREALGLRKVAAPVVALAILTVAPTPGSAQQWDPTQSWLYRHTGWVDRTYPAVNTAQRFAPHVAPPQYRPQAQAFHYGWTAGNYLSNRMNLGERVYQRFMANPSGGGRRR
jgi:hypothetical protein